MTVLSTKKAITLAVSGIKASVDVLGVIVVAVVAVVDVVFVDVGMEKEKGAEASPRVAIRTAADIVTGSRPLR